MSLKIYNGYKLNLLTMTEFEQFLNECRIEIQKYLKEKYESCVILSALRIAFELAELEKESQEYYLKLLYTKFNHNLPKTIEDVKNEFSYSYSGIYFNVAKKYVEMESCLHSFQSKLSVFDFDAEFAFKPIKDKLLCLIYNDNIAKILLESKSLEKYGLKSYFYWDNTDMPEEISKEEWKKREYDWNFLYDFTPADSCICINLGYTNNYSFPDLLEIDKMRFQELKDQKLHHKIYSNAFSHWMETTQNKDLYYFEDLLKKEDPLVINLIEEETKKVNKIYSWITYERMNEPILKKEIDNCDKKNGM